MTVLAEDALAEVIRQNGPLSAMVSDEKGLRFYCLKAPQGTRRQYITYQRYHSTPGHVLSDPTDPAGNTADGLHRYEFLLTACADDADEMIELREAMRLAFDGIQHVEVTIDGKPGAFGIDSLTWLSDQDHFFDPLGANDVGTFASLVHLLMFAPESIPSQQLK